MVNKMDVKEQTGKLVAAIAAVLVVVIIAAACIKICVAFALSKEQIILVEKCVPLLESIVWPLLVLIIVFMFADEIRGIIARSYLPYSPAPYDSSDSSDPDIGSVEGAGAFDQKVHEKRVAEILKRLEAELGTAITTNVRMLQTGWKCNAGCIMQGITYYIAILPHEFHNRIDVITQRVNGGLKNVKSHMGICVLICLYDCDKDTDLSDEFKAAHSKANCKIVFRCYK